MVRHAFGVGVLVTLAAVVAFADERRRPPDQLATLKDTH